MKSNTPPLVRAPAASGLGWVVKSYTLLRLQWAPLLLSAVMLQLLVGLAQIPVLGLFIVLSVPVLSAGILQGFHLAAQGIRPGPLVIFRPFGLSPHRGRLLLTGALVFVVGFICIMMGVAGQVDLQDPGLVQRLEQGDVNAVYELGPEAITRIFMAFLIGVGVSGTLSYFTIPLLWFHDLPLGQALSLGLKGLMVNWKPLLVLAVVLALVLVPVVFLASFLLGLVMGEGLAATLLMAVMLLLLLTFQLLLFGVQYCSAREVFPFIEPENDPSVESLDKPSGDSDDNQFEA